MSDPKKIIEEAVHSGEINGAVVVAGRSKDIVYEAAAGNVALSSIFDIGSMTQSLATSVIFMALASQKGVNLNALACKYWPDFSEEGKENITIRHLLKHTSGLPADRPYYQELVDKHPDFMGTSKGKEFILSQVANEGLERPPTYVLVPSNIGYIALGHIAEIIDDKPFQNLFDQYIARPLGLTNSSFKASCADMNARAMGGAAGHAGLFTSAHDAVKIGMALIGDFLPQAIVAEFVGPKARYKLGWESYYQLAKNSVGHTNSNGSSILIDLENNTVVAVFISSEKKSIDLLPQIYSAIMSQED